MAADDPGILEPWQWEIIAFADYEKREVGHGWTLPGFDISLGFTESIQASFVAPYVTIDLVDEGARSDFGNGQVGVKWRFLNRGPVQLATGLNYDWNIKASAVRRESRYSSLIVGAILAV